MPALLLTANMPPIIITMQGNRKYIEAKQEYEKLLNPNDDYLVERIAASDIRIPRLPRIIRVKVTDANGNNMSDVAFSTDEYKVDKNDCCIHISLKFNVSFCKQLYSKRLTFACDFSEPASFGFGVRFECISLIIVFAEMHGQK